MTTLLYVMYLHAQFGKTFDTISFRLGVPDAVRKIPKKSHTNIIHKTILV